ncbi:MAG: YgfZ/GcvT domain-containing protein [Actinomycetota bacterium]
MLVYADRSDRAKLRAAGPQAAWFLDQILTQSFDDITPGEARDAAMITVHGRMTGYLEAVATEDAILCHFESELRAVLPAELAKYVFATQVELADVTDERGLVLVAGQGWEQVVSQLGGTIHPSRSLGIPAGYLWTQRDAVSSVVGALETGGLERASEDDLEAIRIANGVARWGYDMDTKTFPQEAGIDERAVNYDKGCYLGQEAMAKIHFRGKVNRALRRLVASGPLEPGSDVVLGAEKVGTVTSASDGRGLAMVRYTIEPGTRVLAGSTEAEVVA